jgi:hypothetical protein
MWMVTMYLLPMQAMIRAWPAFFTTLTLFVASVAGIYLFWYRPSRTAEPVAFEVRPEVKTEVGINA